MPQLTREFEIDEPVEETWEFFMTPDQIAPCLPGCESVEEVEEDVFDAEIKVKVAYTNLTFDVRTELANQIPPNSATVEAKGEPSGRMPGSATVDGDLELTDDGDGGTEGTIGIEFAIRGRLGSLGESAFKHKCEQLTDEFLTNVTEELEEREEEEAVVE